MVRSVIVVGSVVVVRSVVPVTVLNVSLVCVCCDGSCALPLPLLQSQYALIMDILNNLLLNKQAKEKVSRSTHTHTHTHTRTHAHTHTHTHIHTHTHTHTHRRPLTEKHGCSLLCSWQTFRIHGDMCKLSRTESGK